MFPPYPQHAFFRFVEPYISRGNAGMIVDAPCGSGYITYMVSCLTDGKVIGADLEEEAIRAARQNYRRSNLSYLQKDIHVFLETATPIQTYLLINSIFLLPDPMVILKKIHRHLEDSGRLCVVIPNIRSANFKTFQQLDPLLNTLVLDKEQAEDFFRQAGFATEKVEGLAFTRQYGNWLIPLTWRLRGLYTYGWHHINRMLGGAPSYWGFILYKQ